MNLQQNVTLPLKGDNNLCMYLCSVCVVCLYVYIVPLCMYVCSTARSKDQK